MANHPPSLPLPPQTMCRECGLRKALERLQQIDPQTMAERFTSIMALSTVVRQIADDALAATPVLPRKEREAMPDQDTVGLIQKYKVLKRAPDGTWVPKETGCFVLSPEKNDGYGRAARFALNFYAHCIAGTNPKLARDLYDWVAKIQGVLHDA